ncbi:hypothetical protein [Oceanobacillus sp. Castelsardo]|uniref:hypothetical protein n=1 Tax=Oceanobacillus sp. Castelsardo TaxID=1851204 RepID=UPI00083991ED|nr:hypothetical protein [Oceanobacillus sp. Castelsardo]
MNTTGFIRGYMAKNLEGEKFLNHVIEVIEKQLQEWNENYKIEVTKTEGYSLSVQDSTQTAKISISNSLLESLQLQSPYSLDRYIWIELKENGVEIGDANDNYLDYVFR